MRPLIAAFATTRTRSAEREFSPGSPAVRPHSRPSRSQRSQPRYTASLGEQSEPPASVGVVTKAARHLLMSRLDEVAERDGWRCWLCDEPVDPRMSVNDDRGPSVDGLMTAKAAKSKGGAVERLAHRGCNTRKGAIKAVVPWPAGLFVADPAPLIGVAERLGVRAAAKSWLGAPAAPTPTRPLIGWSSGSAGWRRTRGHHQYRTGRRPVHGRARGSAPLNQASVSAGCQTLTPIPTNMRSC